MRLNQTSSLAGYLLGLSDKPLAAATDQPKSNPQSELCNPNLSPYSTTPTLCVSRSALRASSSWASAKSLQRICARQKK